MKSLTFENCPVEDCDLEVIECHHPEDMTEMICRKTSNYSMCLVYKRCPICGAEMPYNIVERCDICLKDYSEETHHE